MEVFRSALTIPIYWEAAVFITATTQKNLLLTLFGLIAALHSLIVMMPGEKSSNDPISMRIRKVEFGTISKSLTASFWLPVRDWNHVHLFL